MTITANEYLDARKPHWTVAEKAGGVRYDLMRRGVVITDPLIIQELKG